MDESSASNGNGIITLQVGHYSNFIGTHWWNIQQSERLLSNGKEDSSQLEHGLLLREDLEMATGRIRYTPRLLCIDLKGSLKAMKEDGSFQKEFTTNDGDNKDPQSQLHHIDNGCEGDDIDEDDDEISVDEFAPGSFSIHKTERIRRSGIHRGMENTRGDTQSMESNYFGSDDVVEVWSDFMGNDYHQKSVLILDDYWYNSDSNAFSSFGQGFATNTNQNFWDSWEDRMHFFAEECDNLQGFQILADLSDGFGGLTIRVLENLYDCYGKKAMAVYGSWPGVPCQNTGENTQLINSALAIGKITQHNSLFVPMSLQEMYYGKEDAGRKFQHLSYKAESHYHSSAILASFLDSISLGYRLGNTALSDLCTNMTITGHNIASASMSLPVPTNSPSVESIVKEPSLFGRGLDMVSLSPTVGNTHRNMFSQQVALRGFPREYLQFDDGNKRLLKSIANYDLFHAMVFGKCKAYKTGATFCEKPLQTLHPYPKYFTKNVGNNGFIQTDNERKGSVNQVPVLSCLTASNGVFDLLLNVIKSTNRARKSDYASFEQYGIEKEEINENMEQLINLAYLYDEKTAAEFL